DAPIQPNVSSEVDTSHINFEERDLSASGPFSGSGSGTGKFARNGCAFAAKKAAPAFFTGDHISFAGFTFIRDHVYLRNRLQSSASDRLGIEADPGDATLEASAAVSGSGSGTAGGCGESTDQVSELRTSLQAAERQAAINAVALREAERRLSDALATNLAAQATADKHAEEARSRLAAAQADRDKATEQAAALTRHLAVLQAGLETERQTAAAAAASSRQEVNCLQDRFAEAETRAETLLKQLSEARQQIEVAATTSVDSDYCSGVPCEKVDNEQVRLEAELLAARAEAQDLAAKVTQTTSEMSMMKRSYSDQVSF
ncbi:unnamed protein product, partial [Protopolystoma xenopodis]